jgi:hypothetical protein
MVVFIWVAISYNMSICQETVPSCPPSLLDKGKREEDEDGGKKRIGREENSHRREI